MFIQKSVLRVTVNAYQCTVQNNPCENLPTHTPFLEKCPKIYVTKKEIMLLNRATKSKIMNRFIFSKFPEDSCRTLPFSFRIKDYSIYEICQFPTIVVLFSLTNNVSENK